MTEQELVDGFIAARETGMWEEFFAWCRDRGFRFAGDPIIWEFRSGTTLIPPGDWTHPIYMNGNRGWSSTTVAHAWPDA